MTIRKDFIPLLAGIDLTRRQLPLLVADSGSSGPTIWLTAAIHGDEVTGTAIIQSVFKRFEYDPLRKGKIYAIPILNPTGFETISRRETNTGADLNRHFGGNENGSTPERIAATILNAVLKTKPDYVIDLHSDSINSTIYTLVDFPKILTERKTLEKSIAVAQTLGFNWAIDTEKTAGYPLEECFTGRLMSEGIPAVTIEAGWPYIVVDEYRTNGLTAIWNFLGALNMVADTARLISTVPKHVYTFAERITTQSTGIIEYRVKPGDLIKKDQILGRVRNVFAEKIETIKSPVDGLLFSHEDQSVTFPGLTLFTLAVVSDFETVTKTATLEISAEEVTPERTG